MKITTRLIALLIFVYNCPANATDTVYAELFDCKQEEFSGYCAKTIDEYKRNTELWGGWSFPIGNVRASSELRDEQGITYPAQNISDYDLNSAWFPQNSPLGLGEYFEFEFEFPKNTGYAAAYQFMGICHLFNGYCKSLDHWQANCRIKKLKVFYNGTPLCYVILKDTWKYQRFDISRYFVNARDGINLDARYEIKDGDKLRFQIVEIYKGSKNANTAISEFLCQGGGN